MTTDTYTRAEKFHAIGVCLDRYENLLRNAKEVDWNTLNGLFANRIDRFIDLDVCGVDVFALSVTDDETLAHDMSGIFDNLDRDTDTPENSRLVMFSPRVGMLKKILMPVAA